MAGNAPKKTRGRQKIEMKKIVNEDEKLITFSKRRSGINKKASELVTLTGSQIAFMVYSPAGKPFSFGHPSMNAVVKRFLDEQGDEETETANPLLGTHRLLRIEDMNRQHNELLEQLDVEQQKWKQVKEQMKGLENNWWDTPIEELNVQQLLEMEAVLKATQLGLINNFRDRTGGPFDASSSTAQPQVPLQPEPQVQVQPHVQPEREPQLEPFPDQLTYDTFNPFAFNANEQLHFPANYDDWSEQM
ncbi:Agamous-like MADS-box protein AGL62 [Euphorbia peplus]|nr:Agamous-like MADS-box protein AGL62 [Euphorbia peplus]